MKAQQLLNHLILSDNKVLALTSFGTGTPGLKGIDVSRAGTFVSLRHAHPGMPETSEYLDVAALDRKLHEIGMMFDVIFVDPFHTFEASFELLTVALNHASTRAVIVVHDCMPFDVSLSTEPVDVDWSGVTFAAFRSFVESLNRNWFVVDDDFGLGVIGPEIPTNQNVIRIENEPRTQGWQLAQFISEFESRPRELMRGVGPNQAFEALSILKECGDCSPLIVSYCESVTGVKGKYIPPKSGSRLSRFMTQKSKELKILLTV